MIVQDTCLYVCYVKIFKNTALPRNSKRFSIIRAGGASSREYIVGIVDKE